MRAVWLIWTALHINLVQSKYLLCRTSFIRRRVPIRLTSLHKLSAGASIRIRSCVVDLYTGAHLHLASKTYLLFLLGSTRPCVSNLGQPGPTCTSLQGNVSVDK